MISKPQERVLREMYRKGLTIPFYIEHRSMGGAFRRMIFAMTDSGLLNRPNPNKWAWEITAEGLRAIHASATDIYNREKFEREREEHAKIANAQAMVNLDAAFERRKTKIIAKVRSEFPMAFGLEWAHDDTELWQLITRIVEIERTT